MLRPLALRSTGRLGRSCGAAGGRRALAKEARCSCAAAGDAAASMDGDVEQLVRSIHASPYKAAVYVTGGAAQGMSWLLGVPGASSTVLEAVVPYSRGSLVELLGQEPEQYCSADAALALARAAYQRAVVLSRFGEPVVGLGASCALASEPPKRGEHRAYLAAAGGDGARLLSLRLAKGQRTRWQEEQLVSRALLQVLAQACGVDAAGMQLPLAADAPQPGGGGDEVATQALPAPEPLAELLAGRVRCVEFSGGRVFVDAPRGGRLYLPGSFNPLHDGHTALLAAALRAAPHCGEAGFELSVANADKGCLELDDVRRRVAQFVAAGLPLLVTAAPLLVDKARLLPGSTFVVGWDTAVRLVMPKYYGGSDAAMAAVFEAIRAARCAFLVAGRADAKGGGGFMTLDDVDLPAGLADLFVPLPGFRSDLSSTALRAAGKGLGSGGGSSSSDGATRPAGVARARPHDDVT